MKKVTLYRLSFRLTSKDADLLWLDADSRFKMTVLVKRSIRTILNGQAFQIPLPIIPEQKSLKSKIIGVRFYKNEDEDIVEWLQKIEKGSRGFIVKRLLRHAMVAVDYRPYHLEGNAVKIIIEERKNEEFSYRRVRDKENYESSGKLEKDEFTDGCLNEKERQEEGSDESDWFAAFSMLANQ